MPVENERENESREEVRVKKKKCEKREKGRIASREAVRVEKECE